ncbi:MAG TPA: hypothetical protein VI386_06005, partial [Candidatus Sulfotelmatobacter sp.]
MNFLWRMREKYRDQRAETDEKWATFSLLRNGRQQVGRNDVRRFRTSFFVWFADPGADNEGYAASTTRSRIPP